LLWGQTISPLFHTNWALLGPKLDELEAILHASKISQATLGPSCSIYLYKLIQCDTIQEMSNSDFDVKCATI
jgi:hypothetical protein